MTLLVAYAGWRGRTPGRRADQAYKRASDAAALPVGPAHAVEERSDVALGRVRVGPQPARREWPPGTGSRCPNCREQAGQPAS